MKIRLIFVAFFSTLLFAGCATLNSAASLFTCKYDLKNVTDPRIAGIGLTNVSDINKLDAAAALKLTTGLLAGSLPLSATVNVGVVNPNATQAQVEGVEWALFFQNTNILSGTTAQPVYVAPNGGRSTIPLDVQVDLIKLFGKNSKDDIFTFVNGLLHLGDGNSQVSLKIRPILLIANQPVKTGFITLQKSI